MRMAKPIFPWMGNKVKLLPFIQKMIPPNVKQYLEPFGGSGAVVLGLKPSKNRLDIYNDLNNDLFNVFCCIKERPLAFCKELGGNLVQHLPLVGNALGQDNVKG